MKKTPAKKVVPLKTLAQLKNDLSLLREENLRLRFEASRGMWLSHQDIREMLASLDQLEFYLSGILFPFEEYHSCSFWQRIRLFFSPFSYFDTWSQAKHAAKRTVKYDLKQTLTRLIEASTTAKEEEPKTNG